MKTTYDANILTYCQWRDDLTMQQSLPVLSELGRHRRRFYRSGIDFSAGCSKALGTPSHRRTESAGRN